MSRAKKSLENMRDCVKQAFLEGCERGDEFIKMRHAIISELKRLGYDQLEVKDKLSEWNERCEKPLNSKEAKVQLYGYTDWLFKKDGRTGCKALQDYCFGKERCGYHLKTTAKNRQETKELPFDLPTLKRFIEKRFKAEGYKMNLVLEALIYRQHHETTGTVILIGFRSIAGIVRKMTGQNISPMTIHRTMKLLIDEGAVERVVEGKPGMFRGLANGYRFLPWRPPEPRTDSGQQPQTAEAHTMAQTDP